MTTIEILIAVTMSTAVGFLVTDYVAEWLHDRAERREAKASGWRR